MGVHLRLTLLVGTCTKWLSACWCFMLQLSVDEKGLVTPSITVTKWIRHRASHVLLKKEAQSNRCEEHTPFTSPNIIAVTNPIPKPPNLPLPPHVSRQNALFPPHYPHHRAAAMHAHTPPPPPNPHQRHFFIRRGSDGGVVSVRQLCGSMRHVESVVY